MNFLRKLLMSLRTVVHECLFISRVTQGCKIRTIQLNVSKWLVRHLGAMYDETTRRWKCFGWSVRHTKTIDVSPEQKKSETITSTKNN